MNLSERFSDPRFAETYDELFPATERIGFFTWLTEGMSLDILDVGCGTGRLACLLAQGGHRVTGTDPGPAMLEVARRRAGADKVDWVETDAAGMLLKDRFDLIIMTGHTFQLFLSDAEVTTVLSNLRRQLARSGRLAFETRNPEVRLWDEWTPGDIRRVETAGYGMVESRRMVQSVDGELVSFEHHLEAAGDTLITTNTIRFMPQERLRNFLEAAGFTQSTWYGDWDHSPVHPNCPELIVVAS